MELKRICIACNILPFSLTICQCHYQRLRHRVTCCYLNMFCHGNGNCTYMYHPYKFFAVWQVFHEESSLDIGSSIIIIVFIYSTNLCPCAPQKVSSVVKVLFLSWHYFKMEKHIYEFVYTSYGTLLQTLLWHKFSVTWFILT